MDMRRDCDYIVNYAISRVLPQEAVKRALENKSFSDGRVLLVSVGKAAWSMANAAFEILGDRIDDGIVVTKHGYSQGEIGKLKIFEAGHPVPDEDSFSATAEVLKLTENLKDNDEVVFLLSGGGSAIFEEPAVSPGELRDITEQLLACGADIVEINTIRKRLSKVKGGRFALHCAPAKIFTVVLSDVLGDRLDTIASGPAYPDSSTCREATDIVEKYGLRISDEALECLNTETPKVIDNVTTVITGSVRELCKAAADACVKLGYEPEILTDSLSCEAREAGRMLAEMVRDNPKPEKPRAFIAGGETVVHLTGKGMGGRNQEIAMGAAEGIPGINNVCVFSVGSDGTDGPTDAAGGYADGSTKESLSRMGIDIEKVLEDNDSYNALKKIGGLIITGATGTNVNDVAVALIKTEDII